METADSAQKKQYRQVFSQNMSKKGQPEIKAYAKGEDYTRITFRPDLGKFGMTDIDDDLNDLLVKRVYDMAGCVAGIKVFLNGERIKIKGFKQYVETYLKSCHDQSLRGIHREFTKCSIMDSSKSVLVHEIVDEQVGGVLCCV